MKEALKAHEQVLIPWEAGGLPLRQAYQGAKDIALVIGPEGGMTGGEVEALGGHRTPKIAGMFIRAANAAVGKLGVKWVYASGLSYGVGPVLKELALARLDRSGHVHDVQEKTKEAVGAILPSNSLRIVYRDFNRQNSVFLASTWFPNALTRAEVL